MRTSEPIIFCCLNAGNYCDRGAQYVNTLLDMVVRNMPSGVPFEFHCLTDNADGLDPRIEIRDLPDDLERWYGKLYFFKRDLFPDGARIVYFDLDTLIIGKLDEIVTYRGQFATLTDFFFPERLGPAVMLWEAGDYVASIWEEWVACGKPRNQMGDLWWLNNLEQGRFAKRADRLQKLFPGAFVSYKSHCDPLPPRGARVVCFHGHPRPHEAADDWVAMAWQVGGMALADNQVVPNTAPEVVARNIAAACALPHPWLEQVPPHAGRVAIVGGGPSLKDMLPELRERAAAGVKVYAVNGAHEYLVERGLVPDLHVIIDARPQCTSFIQTPAKAYALASQCAPETFRRASGAVTIVHMHTAGVLDAIPPSLKPINLISSGTTVLLAAMAIAYCQGYRVQYLYGADSSYEDSRHVYPQSLNDHDRVIDAVAGGRKFKCAPWMVRQAQDFQRLAAELANDGCEIHVRSRGLLGHVAWLMANQVKEEAA